MSNMSYLKKIFLSLILISVIPILIIGTTSIYYYSRVIINTLTDKSESEIRELDKGFIDDFFEFEAVLNELSSRDDIEAFLLLEKVSSYYENDLQNVIDRAVRSMQHDYDIHIISLVSNLNYSTSEIPDIYNINVFKHWGIFKVLEGTSDTVIYPHSYKNTFGERIIISYARPLINSSGTTIGYVIIDVKSDYLTHMEVYKGSDTLDNLKVYSKDAIVILNNKEPQSIGLYDDNSIVANEVLQESGIIEQAKDKLLIYRVSSSLPFVYVNEISTSNAIRTSEIIRNVMGMLVVVSTLLCLILAMIFANYMSAPIKRLVSTMQLVEQGNLDCRVEVEREDEFGILGRQFNNMLSRIQELLKMLLDEKEQIKIAEFEALQAQINPHFINNTLSNIKSLSKFGRNQDIGIVTTEFGKLLRNAMDFSSETQTLHESLNLIDSYLRIQNIRHENRFDVQKKIEDHLYDWKIPKLLLQPIVENAIIHGLEKKVGKGYLVIEGYESDAGMTILIRDNGVGMDGQVLQSLINKLQDSDKTAEHIGLINVHNRIRLYYGDNYGIELSSVSNEGTEVKLTLGIKKMIMM